MKKSIWIALTEREDDIPPIAVRAGTRDACMDFLERRMRRCIDKKARKLLNVPDPAWTKVSDRCRILTECHDMGISYGTVERVKVLP